MVQAKVPAKHNPFKPPSPVADCSFSIGAETGGNTIAVAIQLKDADGKDIAHRASVLAYLSADANGDTTAVASSGAVAIGTDGLMHSLVSKLCFRLTSEADGDIDITIIEAGALTQYLVVVMPDGTLKVSGAITFV